MPALDAAPTEEEPELFPFRINRLMSVWNGQLDVRLTERGSGLSQWRVLMVAARAGRPLTIVELAALTMVPHSTLSRQLAAMERDGLLRRTRNAEDGRAVSVQLTPRGRARYREWLPLALEEAEVVLGALSVAERASLHRIIGRMEEVLALARADAGAA